MRRAAPGSTATAWDWPGTAGSSTHRPRLSPLARSPSRPWPLPSARPLRVTTDVPGLGACRRHAGPGGRSSAVSPDAARRTGSASRCRRCFAPSAHLTRDVRVRRRRGWSTLSVTSAISTSRSEHVDDESRIHMDDFGVVRASGAPLGEERRAEARTTPWDRRPTRRRSRSAATRFARAASGSRACRGRRRSARLLLARSLRPRRRSRARALCRRRSHPCASGRANFGVKLSARAVQCGTMLSPRSLRASLCPRYSRCSEVARDARHN